MSDLSTQLEDHVSHYENLRSMQQLMQAEVSELQQKLRGYDKCLNEAEADVLRNQMAEQTKSTQDLKIKFKAVLDKKNKVIDDLKMACSDLEKRGETLIKWTEDGNTPSKDNIDSETVKQRLEQLQEELNRNALEHSRALQEASETSSALQTRAASLEGEIQSLNAQNASLVTELKDVAAAKDNLSLDCERLSQSVERQREALAKEIEHISHSSNSEVARAREQHAAELANLKESHASLLETVKKNHAEQIQVLETQLQEREGNAASERSRIESVLKERLASAEATLEESNQKLAELKQSHSDAMESLRTQGQLEMEKAVASLRSEHAEAQTRMKDDWQREVAQLRDEHALEIGVLKEKHDAEKRALKDEHQTQLQIARAEVERTVARENSETENLRERLQHSESSLASAEKKHAALQSLYQAMEISLEESLNQVDELQKKVESRNGELSALKRELESVDAERQRLRKLERGICDALGLEATESANLLSSLHAILQQHEAGTIQMKLQLQEAQSKETQSQSELQTLQNKVSQLQQARQSSVDKDQHLSADVEKLQEAIAKANSKYQGAEKEKEQALLASQTWRKRAVAVCEQVQQLSRSVTGLSVNLTPGNEADLEALLPVVGQLVSMLDVRTAKVSELSKAVVRLKQLVTDANAKVKEQRQIGEGTKDLLREKLEGAEMSLAEERQNLQTLQGQLDSLRGEYRDYKARAALALANKREATVLHDEEECNKEVEEHHHHHLQENGKLQASLEQALEQVRFLQSESARLQQAKLSMVQQVEGLQSRLEESESRNASLLQENLQLQSAVSQSEKEQVGQLKLLRQQCTAQVEALELELAQDREIKLGLEEKLESIVSSEREKGDKRVAERDMKINGLRQEVAVLESRISNLQEEMLKHSRLPLRGSVDEAPSGAVVDKVRSGVEMEEEEEEDETSSMQFDHAKETHIHATDSKQLSSAAAPEAVSEDDSWRMLAQVQARRDEEVHRLREEIRRLKEEVQSLRGSEAQSRAQLRAKSEELERLMRGCERAEMDIAQLEYLKNVVLNFAEHVEQQESLFPVLATVLQLNPQEIQQVMQRRIRSSSWQSKTGNLANASVAKQVHSPSPFTTPNRRR
jgi:chromosome segregation ATPase